MSPRSARPKTNLVRPLGRFVGRAAVLEALSERIAHGERLITLLGAPGVGKTRLAVRWAELHGEPYLRSGGVWFCDLTEAQDVGKVCSAVAATLGIRLAADLDAQATAEIVGTAIAEAGPLLLILDNVERIAAVAARTVERWCAIAPEACLLVTSRRRLDVAGERIVELTALEEAAELFVDRARAAGWDDARASAASEVDALVRALDGIPLAIELAAARSRVLAPAELLARIAKGRPSILSGLDAAIDSSWNMLSEDEKAALAQCSVFAGDFSLDAAEAVLGVPSVIEVLGGLRDKSLVRSSVDPESGTTRFSLFASIREYASQRARERPDDQAAARHRRYYVDATRAWAEEHARSGDVRSLSKLAREKEHLLAIQRDLRARSSLSAEEAEDLARAVLHLQPVIVAEGTASELDAMLTDAIAAAERAGDDRLRGRMLFERGLARGVRGEMTGSFSDLLAARDLAIAGGDRVLEGSVQNHLSVRYRVQGKLDEAWELAERATALLEDAGHPRLLGTNLACTGLLLCELGRTEEARAFDVRARAVLSAAGDRWSEALPLVNLAQLDQAAGDFERAAVGYERGLERFRESGDRRFEGRYRGFRAGLELERGDLDAARAEYATALEILSVSRAAHLEGIIRAALGALEAISGHAREAILELDRAEDVLRTTEAPAFVAALDVHRGQLDLLFAREAESKGDRDRATRLVASARERIERAKDVRSEDVRFAIRLLERELRRRPAAAASRRGLDVGPEARWFRVGEAEPVDLARRGSLRLVLDGLVTRRLDVPGTTTDWEALLAIGWPGERVLAGAGATRVRVAISTLRRMGLAGVLVTRDDGYLLDPRAPVRRVPRDI